MVSAKEVGRGTKKPKAASSHYPINFDAEGDLPERVSRGPLQRLRSNPLGGSNVTVGSIHNNHNSCASRIARVPIISPVTPPSLGPRSCHTKTETLARKTWVDVKQVKDTEMSVAFDNDCNCVCVVVLPMAGAGGLSVPLLLEAGDVLWGCVIGCGEMNERRCIRRDAMQHGVMTLSKVT